MNRWIFLRGWTREASHWGAFPELFRRVVPDAPVTLVDLPGNGALHGISCLTCVGNMVEHCRQTLPDQRIPPPIACCRSSAWWPPPGASATRPC